MKIKTILLSSLLSFAAVFSASAQEVSVLKNSDAIAYINVSALEKSVFKPVLDTAREQMQKSISEETGVNANLFNEVQNALISANLKEKMLSVVLKGNFDVAKFENIFEESKKKDESLKVTEIKGGKVYYSDDLAVNVQTSSITAGTNLELLQRVIAGKDSKKVDLKALSKSGDTTPFIMAYVENPDLTTDEEVLAMDPSKGIKNLGLSFGEEGKNIVIKVSAEAVNENVAKQMQMQVQGMAAMFGQMMVQENPEIAKALQSLTIEASGTYISAKLSQDSAKLSAEIKKNIDQMKAAQAAELE